MKISTKPLLLGAATIIGALALPAATFAATYQYVNTSGLLETEVAPDSVTALTQPTDIAPDSGVILVPDTDVSPITTTVVTPGTVTTVTPVPTTTTGTMTTGTNTDGMTTTSNTSLIAGSYIGTAPTTYANGQSLTLMLSESTTTPVNDDDATINAAGGAATLTSTVTNGPTTIQSGTWMPVGSNEIQVTLTNNSTSGAYSTPQVIIFTMNGNMLTATQYDTTVYGSSNFSLTKQI